jgi:excisionase family DNA binding protein
MRRAAKTKRNPDRPKRKAERTADRLWRVPEIAERADVAERTVRRWIDRGELLVHRLGRTVRISEADFAAFLARHRSGGEE